ncbi:hypothetical protein L2E82_32190 [Cichorium intybus]|uniref:Uncharacterized protein n=1 Tax=Cichorium intybus TaxID=13427 RepID=A0ACB9BFA7_CICIN|nr:hypothetical protein L2E82_32190 [Cichorium intybus]
MKCDTPLPPLTLRCGRLHRRSTFRKILDKGLFGNFPLHPNPLYINFPLSCVFILCGLIVSLPNSLSFVPLTPSGSL